MKKHKFHLKSKVFLTLKAVCKGHLKQSRQPDFEIFPYGPNQGGPSGDTTFDSYLDTIQ